MLEQQKPKNPVSKQADNSIAGVKPRADGRFYSLDGTKSMSAKEFKEYVEKNKQSAKEAQLKVAKDDLKYRASVFGTRGNTFSSVGIPYAKFGMAKASKGSKSGNVDNSWSNYYIPENMKLKAFEQQSAYDLAYDFAVGGLKRFTAGFIGNLSSADIGNILARTNGLENYNYTNPLQDFSEYLSESADRENQIYLDPSGSRFNGAYLAHTGQQLAYTVGIMAETLGEAYLFGKFFPSASLFGTASKLQKAKTLAKDIGWSSFMGIREAIMNARETEKGLYDDLINKGYSHEDAQQKARRAGNIHFKTEAMSVVALNTLQNMALLGSLRNSGKGIANSSVWSGNNIDVKSGISDLFSTIGENLYGGVKNKWMRRALTGITVAGSESIEEGVQTGIGIYATNKALGLGTSLSDITNSEEFTESVIQGSLGGLFLGAGSKLISKIKNRKFERNYKEHIANLLKETSNNFNAINNLNNELNSAINELGKTTDQNKKSELINKIQELQYQKSSIEQNFHTSSVISSLGYDYSKGDGNTLAFDSYVETLQSMLDAVNQNDIEKMKSFNLLDVDGKETSPNIINNVKETFQSRIEDAKKIKSLFEHELANTSKNFNLVSPIVANKFQAYKNEQQIGFYNQEIDNKAKSMQKEFGLSDNGVRRLNLEAEKSAILNDPDLSTSEDGKARLAEIEEELTRIGKYSNEDKAAMRKAGFKQNRKGIMNQLSEWWGNVHTFNDINNQLLDKANEMSSPEALQKAFEEMQKKRVKNAETKEDVDNIVEEAKNNGNNSETLQQEAEKKKEELSTGISEKDDMIINPVQESTKLPLDEDRKVNEIIDLFNINQYLPSNKENNETVEQSNSEEFEPALSNNEVGTTTMSDEEYRLNSDVPSRFNRETADKADKSMEKIKGELIELSKGILENLEKELGRKPTLKDFLDYFIERFGKNSVESKFNSFVKLAEELGLDISKANKYYDATFTSIKDLVEKLVLDENLENTQNPDVKESVEEVSTPESVIEQNKEADKVANESEPKSVKVNSDIDIAQVREIQVVEHGREKISTPMAKLAFNFISKLFKGRWLINTHKLDTNPFIDNHYILDPDFMVEVSKASREKPGSVYIEAVDDDSIPVTIYNKDGSREVITYGQAKQRGLGAKQAVPMVVFYNNGKEVIPVSFIHNETWYTPHNTANKEVEEGGRINIRGIREQVIDNGGRLAISIGTQKSGTQVSLIEANEAVGKQPNDSSNFKPANEHNKQSKFVFIRFRNGEFSMIGGKDISFDQIINWKDLSAGDKKQIANRPYMLTRWGTDANGKPTYRASILLTPTPYENARNPHLGNRPIPQNLETTLKRSLLALLNTTLKNPKILESFDKVKYTASEIQKDIKNRLGINVISKFVYIANAKNSNNNSYNTSAGFTTYLNKLKQSGEKFTVFREFQGEYHMAFWDNTANDYRVINLSTLSTKLLSDAGVASIPADVLGLVNQMYEAMSQIKISTNNVGNVNLVDENGNVVEQDRDVTDIYKDVVLTPNISYEIERPDGSKMEISNAQPVIFYNPINEQGNLTPIVNEEQAKQKEQVKPQEVKFEEPSKPIENRPNEVKSENKKESENQEVQEVNEEQEIESQRELTEDEKKLESFLDRKAEFIETLINNGMSATQAVDMFNTQVALMRQKAQRSVDFNSRLNIDLIQIFGENNKIIGLTDKEQKQVISYLKNQLLQNEAIRELLNKNKLTGKELLNLNTAIKNAVDTFIGAKIESLNKTIEVLDNMGIDTTMNKELVAKYQLLLQENNKAKIEETLREDMQDLSVNLSEIEDRLNREVTEEEVSDDSEKADDNIDTSEGWQASFAEKDLKLSFSTALKASLYGMAKKNAKGEVIINEFGFVEYYTPDEVYQRLVDITTTIPNNLNALIEALNSKYEDAVKGGYNGSVYLDMINFLNNLSEERKNELLHKTIAKKLNIYKLIYSPTYTYTNVDGKYQRVVTSYQVSLIDENSNKQMIKLRNAIRKDIMNPITSHLVKVSDGKLILNEPYLEKLVEYLNKFSKEENKSYEPEKIRAIFDRIGLSRISDEAIKLIATVSSEKGDSNTDILYGERGLFKSLANNLTKLSENYKKNGDKVDLSNIRTSPYYGVNALSFVVKAEIMTNTGNVPSSIRVGGKTLQGVIQNTSVYDTVRRLLSDDAREELIENYKKDPFSANSIVLKAILNSAKFREAMQSIGFNSPSTLKMTGEKDPFKGNIDEIANNDKISVYLNLFANEIGELGLEADLLTELEGGFGLDFRIGKTMSTALSDKGRVLYIPSIFANFKAEDIVFDKESYQISHLSQNALDYVYKTIFEGELNRIVESYQNRDKSKKFKSYNDGSKLFLTLPSLNTILLDVEDLEGDIRKGVNIHQVIKEELNNYGIIRPQILEQIKTAMGDKFLKYVQSELDAKIKFMGVQDGNLILRGEYADAGIIQNSYKYENNSLVLEETDEKVKIASVKNVDLNTLRKRPGNNDLEKLRFLAAEHVINNFVTNVENDKIFLGDMAFYFKSKALKPEYTNKGFFTTNFINNLTPERIVRMSKEVAANKQKRAASMIAPGNSLADSEGMNGNDRTNRYVKDFIHVAINDNEAPSQILEHLIKAQYQGELTSAQAKSLEAILDKTKELNNLTNQLEEYESGSPEFNSKLARIETLKKEISKEGKNFPEIEDYFNITGTDAQEYTTWRTHLDMLIRKGQISKEDFDTLTKKIENNEELDSREMGIIFQPVKPVYTGLVFDEETNRMRPVYIKSSSFPLLPSWTKNTKLDNVRKNLEALETDKDGNFIPVRMSYQTANKIGARNTNLTMEHLYSGNPETMKDSELMKSSMSVLPMSNFKIQQETPSKEQTYFNKGKDAHITMGSQFFKVLMGNGIIDEGAVFDNVFSDSILQLAGLDPEEFRDKKLTGQDLNKIYTKVYTQYSNILKEQLLEELGFDTIKYEENETFDTISDDRKLEIMKNIQRVLKTEIARKGYPPYMKEAIELTEDGNFESVIMFDTNRHKFEAMLQSIIASRLINHTLPGNSHIVGSSEGMVKKQTLETLTDNERQGIVWVNPNHEGDLKTTYVTDENGVDVIRKSQILIPSHFKKFDYKSGDYEYIDLTSDEYSSWNEDKTGRVLNLEKIDPSLLDSFGFRIPTSSHQSGTILEVVGFLPRNVGDIVLVPKEHTTQLGEDYDIDKRYIYKSNYIVEESGRIAKLDSINSGLDGSIASEEYIASLKKQLEILTKENEIAESVIEMHEDISHLSDTELLQYIMGKNDVINEKRLINILNKIELNEKEKRTIRKLIRENKKDVLSKRAKRELELKVLENAFIDSYKTVYSSTSPTVQSKVYKPLVTNIAEEAANQIDNKKNSENLNENFSMYSDIYQRELIEVGADGKNAIGVHSNGVITLAQLQRLPENKKVTLGWFYPPYTDNNGKYHPAVFDKYEYTFNNGNTFDGELGTDYKTADGGRDVADQLGENQNVATDNINKSIMYKRNENEVTMGWYNLLAQTKMDMSKDTVDFGNGSKPQHIHLPSYLISQPIVVDFVKELRKLNSIIDNSYMSKSDKVDLAFRNVAMEYGFDFMGAVPYKQEEYNEIFSQESFTSQMLYDNFSRTSDDIKYNQVLAQQQKAILSFLLRTDSVNSEFRKTSKLANIASTKLGISYFTILQMRDALMEAKTNHRLNVLAKNEGEVQTIANTVELIGTNEDLTIEGVQLTNSLEVANKLMPILFDYDNTFINYITGQVLETLGIDSNSKVAIEKKYEVMNAFTDYLNSMNSHFDGNTRSEQERLFKDIERPDGTKHLSLASILLKLQSAKHPILQNALLKDLVVEGKPESGAMMIKHYAQESTLLDKSTKYDAFMSLFRDNTVLGEVNGEVLTVSKFAQDLVSYSLLSDNQNGASGFRNYIPVEYLKAIGYNNRMKEIKNELLTKSDEKAIELNLEEKAQNFILQYFQHNPSKKGIINYKTFVSDVKKNRYPEPYTTVRDNKGNLMVYYNGKLYPVLGSNNNLGIAGINEYNYDNKVTSSIFESKFKNSAGIDSNYQIRLKEGSTTVYDVREFDYTGKVNKLFLEELNLQSTPDGLNSFIDRLFRNEGLNSLNPGLKEVWEVYKDYLPADVQIKFEVPEDRASDKEFYGIYRVSDKTIYINPKAFSMIYSKMKFESPEKDIALPQVFKQYRQLVMEELLHAVQINQIVAGLNTPAGQRIIGYYQKAIELGINNPYVIPVSKSVPLPNAIAEFIAGVYVDEDLRNQIEKHDKGFINRLLNAIKSLMNDMIPGFAQIHQDVMTLMKDNLSNTVYHKDSMNTKSNENINEDNNNKPLDNIESRFNKPLEDMIDKGLKTSDNVNDVLKSLENDINTLENDSKSVTLRDNNELPKHSCK